jgi:hypothetical protein
MQIILTVQSCFAENWAIVCFPVVGVVVLVVTVVIY